MCAADLDCRRLAPAWKLVAIVSNNALSFDCCVVPPEALASYARELDEIADAPCLWDKTDLGRFPSKECVWPGTVEDFDVTPTLFRSPMAFLAQYLAIDTSVAKSAGLRATVTLRLDESARSAQEKLNTWAYQSEKE